VSEPSDSPVPYRVVYSEWARNELKKLTARARERGFGAEVLAALKKMDGLLRMYPQFGQPLRDLKVEPALLCVGVVPPLVVRYTLDEQRRLVTVVSPISTLPQSGF
jgi:hypothetical protein